MSPVDSRIDGNACEKKKTRSYDCETVAEFTNVHSVMDNSETISHCSTSCLCDGLRHHDHPNADSNGLLRAYPCDGTPNRFPTIGPV